MVQAVQLSSFWGSVIPLFAKSKLSLLSKCALLLETCKINKWSKTWSKVLPIIIIEHVLNDFIRHFYSYIFIRLNKIAVGILTFIMMNAFFVRHVIFAASVHIINYVMLMHFHDIIPTFIKRYNDVLHWICGRCICLAYIFFGMILYSRLSKEKTNELFIWALVIMVFKIRQISMKSRCVDYLQCVVVS